MSLGELRVSPACNEGEGETADDERGQVSWGFACYACACCGMKRGSAPELVFFFL